MKREFSSKDSYKHHKRLHDVYYTWTRAFKPNLSSAEQQYEHTRGIVIIFSRTHNMQMSVIYTQRGLIILQRSVLPCEFNVGAMKIDFIFAAPNKRAYKMMNG